MASSKGTPPAILRQPGFDDVEAIVAAVRAGEMVVMLDDEDRENEGDLVMAAAKVDSDDINFMAHNGRGLICLTLTRARCEQDRKSVV